MFCSVSTLCFWLSGSPKLHARVPRFYVAGVACIAGVDDVRHALADSCMPTLKLLSVHTAPAAAAIAAAAAASAAAAAAADAWLWQMFMLCAVVMAMMAAAAAVVATASTAPSLLTDDLMHIDDSSDHTK